MTGSYEAALAAAEKALNATTPSEGSAGVPLEIFLETDRWLRAQSGLKPTRTLARGTAWGRLHELQTGRPLSAGQLYDAEWSDAERPFAELLLNGTFSPESLAASAPAGFMVDPAWEAKLLESAAKHGATWLHHLHLCIIQNQNCGTGSHGQRCSLTHCTASNLKRPNALATYILGDVPAALALAIKAVQATQAAEPAAERMEVDLVRDIGGALLQQQRTDAAYGNLSATMASIRALPAPVSARLMNVQSMRISAVALALYHEHDPAKAIALLHDAEERRGWAVSTPELVPLWYAAVQSRAEAAAGKNLTVLELVKLRRENPPPPALNFGGAT